MASRMDHLELAGTAGVFIALEMLWLTLIGPFRIPYHYWQLLPAPALEQDLWRALFNLHAQPPLLNLILGGLLKAAGSTGLRAETLGAMLNLALGVMTSLYLWILARRLVPRRGPRLAALGIFFANPYLYASIAQLSYTTLELLLLAALGVLALRFFDAPSARRLAAALAPGILIVYTRSLFHPAWFFLVAAALVLLAGPALRARWRAVAAVLAAAALLVLAWPAKNALRFGFFGYSSWAGLNLATGLPIRRAVVVDGFKSRLIDPAAARWLDARVPEEFAADPGIARAMKPDGSPNWNHFTIIGESRAAGELARAYVWRNPGAFWTKAEKFYLGGFATYEARDPYLDIFAVDVARLAPAQSDVAAARGWFDWYERVFFQRFRAAGPLDRARVTTGFAFVFPLLLSFPLAALWVRRRHFGAEEKATALMLLCVGWVLVLTLLVDGYEGNRMRFSTEPFLLLAAAFALSGRLRSGRAQKASPTLS